MNIKILLYVLKLAKDKKGIIQYSYNANVYNIVSVSVFKRYVVLVPAAATDITIDIRKLADKLINADTNEMYILLHGYYYKVIGYIFKDGNLILS